MLKFITLQMAHVGLAPDCKIDLIQFKKHEMCPLNEIRKQGEKWYCIKA